MSLRAEATTNPDIAPVYWFARLIVAPAADDALMMSVARRQLLELGFDVQPIQSQRLRRKAVARSRS